uniref:Uncharacterized protein n=1 Tax=Anguilla anguilla TaxID=7936 RepID=A0A0E9TJH0_ANGAN
MKSHWGIMLLLNVWGKIAEFQHFFVSSCSTD